MRSKWNSAWAAAIVAACGSPTDSAEDAPLVAARMVAPDSVEVTILNLSRNSWALSTCPIGGEELGSDGWRPSERLGSRHNCLFPLVLMQPGSVIRETTTYSPSHDDRLPLRITIFVSPVGKSGNEDESRGRMVVSPPFDPIAND